ncbi:MAG: shikimate kinase [Streptococcaceae bacterium]|nr:shikimate kinase [Streptococcaceae bacterium]MCL2858190.1 shikimate kinase [Streptococcaceae bacterium]
MPVILIGFMGAGKTSLASKLDSQFIDLDQRIEEKIGITISEYFNEYGENAFRQVESEIFEQALLSNRVIATGGGIVEEETNQKLLSAQSQVIYLQVSFDVLYARIQSDKKNNRPLAKDKESLYNLYHKRTPLYEKYSQYTINVENQSAEDIVHQIKQMIQ